MLKKTFFCNLALVLVLIASAATAQNEISPARKQAIDSLAIEKVRDLSKYISAIGDKATPSAEADRIINRALELFEPNAQMGVSSINRPTVRNYPVKDYLRRLRQLRYNKVKIEWYNIQYVSDLVRQPNGIYVGVVTIYQRFEGTMDDGMKYVDTTKKDITIYVRRKEQQIAGRLIGFWDVLLGDVRVSETKRG
jgi:hypothetical protein